MLIDKSFFLSLLTLASLEDNFFLIKDLSKWLRLILPLVELFLDLVLEGLKLFSSLYVYGGNHFPITAPYEVWFRDFWLFWNLILSLEIRVFWPYNILVAFEAFFGVVLLLYYKANTIQSELLCGLDSNLASLLESFLSW